MYTGRIDVVCVLFDGRVGRTVPRYSWGSGYDPEWANKLYRGFRRNLEREMRFVCISHYPKKEFMPEIEVVDFLRDTRDWWCINEVLRQDLGLQRTLFTGLDTIVTGSLEEICSWEGDFLFTGPRRVHVNNAFCLWNQRRMAPLWEGLEEDEDILKGNCRMRGRGRPSEMVYWRKVLKDRVVRLNMEFPHQVVSWKHEWRKNRWSDGHTFRPGLRKDEVRAVYFSGKMKPGGLPKDDPLREHWV